MISDFKEYEESWFGEDNEYYVHRNLYKEYQYSGTMMPCLVR